MIGDKKSDIELAYNSGTQGILLKTGKGVEESNSVTKDYPDVVVLNNFSEAIDYILEKELR
jgi:histidinol phosphatase-like enzyme